MVFLWVENRDRVCSGCRRLCHDSGRCGVALTAVGADLDAVAAALSELQDAELHALIDTANELVLIAAGLLSWIEHLADWEINRRVGLDFPLQAPEAAIPPEEDAESIAAAMMMRDKFAQGSRDDTPNVAALFDAVVGALTGRASLN